jgi:hypothetical protein
MDLRKSVAILFGICLMIVVLCVVGSFAIVNASESDMRTSSIIPSRVTRGNSDPSHVSLLQVVC